MILPTLSAWENDEDLRSCSLAAQGLMSRLFDAATRSPESGVIQTGELQLSVLGGAASIAHASGRPLEEIAPLIDELTGRSLLVLPPYAPDRAYGSARDVACS